MTIFVSVARLPDSSQPLGLPTGSWSRDENREPAWSNAVAGAAAIRQAAQRTLLCYAQAHLVSRLRDVVDVHEAASIAATERAYSLGPLFIEEDGSGQAIKALIEAATDLEGGAAVAVPSRGHLVPLGSPHEWQELLEQITGHSLVFTGRTPQSSGADMLDPCAHVRPAFHRWR